VLVVDDSAVVRGLLSKILAADPDFELAGTAANGALGIEKAAKLKPDVIVLDVEMPVMSGLEALTELRKAHPKTPIVMFSTLTAKGAQTSLEALANGASDYAMKPSNTGSSLSAVEQVKEELMTKLRGLVGTSPAAASSARIGGAAAAPAASAQAAGRPKINRPKRSPNKRIDAVVIGSSTGGPAALEQVVGAIRHPLPVPILLTQHLPPTFTKALADRLNKVAAFPVVEAEEGMEVTAGTCHIAPGGKHMLLKSKGGHVYVTLSEGPKVKSCRPSVDVMTDSVREIYGDQLVAVMLTGMGDDGADAFCRLAELGVHIIAQNEATSVVWGMPGAVERAGAAEQCLPLNEVAGALVRSVSAGRPAAALGVSR
jgi:two-component system chemotaxis response regulator CheB